MSGFVSELEAFKAERLAPIVGAGRMSLEGGSVTGGGAGPQSGPAGSVTRGGDAKAMLQVALANEISVSELAATWMPTTTELDVKLAFARQAGDEANHFVLVAERLRALGFDADAFKPPAESPLFKYLASLSTTVERIAAGLFTLESIAYGVNENFMAFCAARGDDETVRIYREYIQPDELAHQQLGQRLLDKYATTPALQQLARDAVAKVLDIAAATRAKAAEKLGSACFPGC